MVFNPEKIKIITHTENFILIKYKLRNTKPKATSRVECFKLLDNSVEANKYIYN
jgi:hypothetical protein